MPPVNNIEKVETSNYEKKEVVVKMKRLWRKLLIGSPLVMVLALFGLWTQPAFALTTADVTVTATPTFIAIAVDNSTYDFGIVAASAVTNTSTSYFTIDNTSSVQTDQTIAVTGNWTGGVGWTHSDTATAGADTAGLKANKAGTWGAGDVIVKKTAPNYIAENQAATTDYSFGIQLLAPTSFSDGAEKTNTVRVTAAAG